MDILHDIYWQMPTFRSDTILNISSNVSELKKLAAHDLEDLLQVSILSTKLLSILY